MFSVFEQLAFAVLEDMMMHIKYTDTTFDVINKALDLITKFGNPTGK
jgi:hypothetical protein